MCANIFGMDEEPFAIGPTTVRFPFFSDAKHTAAFVERGSHGPFSVSFRSGPAKKTGKGIER